MLPSLTVGALPEQKAGGVSGRLATVGDGSTSPVALPAFLPYPAYREHALVQEGTGTMKHALRRKVRIILPIGLLLLSSVMGRHALAAQRPMSVAWDGGRQERLAAEDLASFMGRSLQTDVPAAKWQGRAETDVFLVTTRHRLDARTRARLDKVRSDGFLVKYPHDVRGRKVCLLAGRDSRGAQFAVNYFLTRYMK